MYSIYRAYFKHNIACVYFCSNLKVTQIYFITKLKIVNTVKYLGIKLALYVVYDCFTTRMPFDIYRQFKIRNNN